MYDVMSGMTLLGVANKRHRQTHNSLLQARSVAILAHDNQNIGAKEIAFGVRIAV